jgi:hypothetical protein
MAVGRLVQCVSSNNGEPLFPWERWFKVGFKFAKSVYYTMVEQDNKIYVITRESEPIEFTPEYFKILFRVK